MEVRDAEGAERALVSAIRSGAPPRELADMLFAAATDHRYLDGGHTLDFANKALEALEVGGSDRAEAVLGSLPAQLANAERMEEANAWRNPVDLVALLERAFAELAGARAAGATRRGGWDDRRDLVGTLLDGEPAAILNALVEALREGRPRSTSPRPSHSRLRRASRASRRATSSATGIPLSTPSRSRTRSSKVCAGRPRRSCSAASSTRR